jgi:hypothetical protein
MLSDLHRRRFLLVNLFGGIAVLGSYLWGVFGAPDTMTSLWGGVPEEIRPIYTVNMLLSAAGYFFFAPFIALRLETDRRDFIGGQGYAVFTVLFALIMIPSALWLPLTSMMIADPSPWLWALIRIDLICVGVGSVGLFFALLRLPPPRPRGRRLALVGLVPFCLQTAVLDALIWPLYFNQ